MMIALYQLLVANITLDITLDIPHQTFQLQTAAFVNTGENTSRVKTIKMSNSAGHLQIIVTITMQQIRGELPCRP
jgi:hypothetical protein